MLLPITVSCRETALRAQSKVGLSDISENTHLTITAVSGLGELYSMSPDLALFLAVVSTALAGDPVTGRWSIGGAFPATLPIFPATGIAGTHNQYEGDASIVRGDAYLNGGRVGVFQMRTWEHLYSQAEEYTLDDVAAQSGE
jgi:hypothetical protein